MTRLLVIKIGGNIIDDEKKLTAFLYDFASLKEKKILVHGGGKLATKLADQIGIKQELVEGRRITDAETLKVVTMVYAGYINKNIIAQLQSNGCNAIGVTGADGNLITARKRIHPSIDFGFVGDVESVNTELINDLLNKNLTIVFAPLTHDTNGSMLNTNADTIAQEIAKAMSSHFEVQLIYSFEKSGVLLDVEDENSVIREINPSSYAGLKEKKTIFSGMIPKLDNAFTALQQGVNKVTIGKAEELKQLIAGNAGTNIVHE